MVGSKGIGTGLRAIPPRGAPDVSATDYYKTMAGLERMAPAGPQRNLSGIERAATAVGCIGCCGRMSA